jgi:hypothetical protein
MNMVQQECMLFYWFLLEYECCWEYCFLTKILQTLIKGFWQHVSTMHNNYCMWLLFFWLRSNHKSISHNLINRKYGLYILSLIWHLLPCSNALFMTLAATTFFHLLHELITLSCYAFFHLFLLYHFLRILLTLYTTNHVHINMSTSSNMIISFFNVPSPPMYQSLLVFIHSFF